MNEHPEVDLDPLRAAIAGDVVTPGDPGWDAARQAWNLVADQHPALVVLAAAPEDVTATVRFAAATACASRPRAPATARRASATSPARSCCDRRG